MTTPNAEYAQVLHTFFYELEKEFHDGVDSGERFWRPDRYKLWAQMGMQKRILSMEGWFQGEIALFLEQLTPHFIAEWDGEFSSGKSRIDYWVSFGKDFPSLALEVKCLIEGWNRDYLFNLKDVAKDLNKIVPEETQVYSLLFMYPRPSEERLQAIKKSLHSFSSELGIDTKISWKGPYYDSSESGLYIDKVELSRL